MISGYVRRGEKVLFAIALVFSIFVVALIAFGAISGVIAAGNAASSFSDEFAMDDYDAEAPLEEEYVEEEYAAEEYTEEEYVEDEYAEEEYLEEGYIGEEYPEDEAYYDDEYYYEDDYDDPSAAGIVAQSMMGVAGVLVFYVVLIFVVVLGAHILMVGHLMGNGVRVNERQFPELWEIFGRAATELGVKKLPAFYIIESGGLLNAFATRLFTRSYVAIYSELAERLYEGDTDSVAFVVAHELVHVKRNHLLKNLITLPAELVPFLKGAWRRACEYTCDAGAAAYAPAGAERGLKLLASGKLLSGRMDAEVYIETFRAEKSIWKRIAEISASHPHLPKRIVAVREFLKG